MRLRLAPVEYKACATEYCSSKYEGAHCPQCRYPFDPERTMKGLHDRLVLVDVDPPIYEPAQRCRCTECKNLFALLEQDVVARAKCSICGEPLLSRKQMEAIWKDADTLLQRARRLDRARRQIRACPHCTHPVPAVCWCPLDRSTPHPSASSCLPQNPTVVWIRTFHIAESLEELQSREWIGGQENDEEWTEEDEAEAELAPEEMTHHAQEQDD